MIKLDIRKKITKKEIYILIFVILLLVGTIIYFYQTTPIEIGKADDIDKIEIKISGFQGEPYEIYYIEQQKELELWVKVLKNIRAKPCISKKNIGNLRVDIYICYKKDADNSENLHISFVDYYFTINGKREKNYVMLRRGGYNDLLGVLYYLD